jgi:hypothetical protein
MPENVGAAILSKIERIFLRDGDGADSDAAQPSRFLAFHVPAMPYDPELLELVNGGGGALTAEAVSQQRAFAELVNMVPAPRALFSTDGAVTWESYGRMLDHGQLARSALSAAEQAELAQADALLYAEDGSLSATYDSYLELQRLWETADERVRNLKLGVATSDDAAYRESQQAELAAAEAALERAEQEWVARGRRFEIEAAIATKIRLGSRALHERWGEREQRFDDGMRDDPDFGSFWRTGFAPEGIVDDDNAWSSITIDTSEISGLVDAARSEVRRAAEGWSPDADANQTNVEVERISMRALKLDVTRPWFDPSLFESGFWRLPGHMPPASDGASPPTGSLPAYVTGLVLVKDIDITLKPSSAANDRLVRHVTQGKIGLIGPFAVRSQAIAGQPTAKLSVRALDVGRMVRDGNDGDARFRAAIQSGAISNASIQAIKVQKARATVAPARVVDRRSGSRVAVAAQPAAVVSRSARRVVKVQSRASTAKPAVRVHDHRTSTPRTVKVRDHRSLPTRSVKVRDHRSSPSRTVKARDHRTGTGRIVRRRVAKPRVDDRRGSAGRLAPTIVRTPGRPIHAIPVKRRVPAPRPPVIREPSLPPTTRPDTPPDKAAEKTMFVVAFLCTRTPKSPAPDLSLEWT